MAGNEKEIVFNNCRHSFWYGGKALDCTSSDGTTMTVMSSGEKVLYAERYYSERSPDVYCSDEGAKFRQDYCQTATRVKMRFTGGELERVEKMYTDALDKINRFIKTAASDTDIHARLVKAISCVDDPKVVFYREKSGGKTELLTVNLRDGGTSFAGDTRYYRFTADDGKKVVSRIQELLHRMSRIDYTI